MSGNYIRTQKHKKLVSETIKKYFSNPENRKKHLKGKLFLKGQQPWNKGLHLYFGGGFKKGNIPWNKGKKQDKKFGTREQKGYIVKNIGINYEKLILA